MNGGGPLVSCVALLYAGAIGGFERRVSSTGRFAALALVAVLAASLGFLESTIPLMLISLSRSFLVLLLLWGIPQGLFIRRRRWDTSMRSITRDHTGPEHEAPRNQSAQQLSDALIAGRQTRPIHEDWNLDSLHEAAKGGRGRRDLTSEIREV